MKLQYDTMNKNKKRLQESDSPLESLRIEFTELTQDEFIVQCGFARATYQRWVRGDSSPKPTPEQMVAICRLCKISLPALFQHLGVDLAGVPGVDRPPKRVSARSHAPTDH